MLDDLGDHALLCKSGGHVVRRHNRIRDALAETISQLIPQVPQVEQMPPDDPQRRPDIGYITTKGRREWIDVEVCTPHVKALPRAACAKRDGVLAAAEEQRKRRLYNDIALHPAVLESRGRPGEALITLVHSMAQAAEARDRSQIVAGIWQDLAIARVRGNAAILTEAGEVAP